MAGSSLSRLIGALGLKSSTNTVTISSNTGATYTGLTAFGAKETSPTSTITGTTLEITSWSSGDRSHYHLLTDGLSNIPSGATVTVQLNLNFSSGSSYSVDVFGSLKPQTSSGNWNTYDGTNAWEVAGTGAGDITSALVSLTPSAGGTVYTFSSAALTAHIQSIVNGTQGNYGFVFKPTNDTAYNGQFQLWSSDTDADGLKPSLVVSYTVASSGASIATSSGTSTAQATGASILTAIGASSGTSTATSIGASVFAGIGNSSGTSSAIATSASGTITTGDGSSSGTSTGSAVGASNSAGSGLAAGISVVNGIANSVNSATGTVSGIALAIAISSSTSSSVGSSTGASTVFGASNATATINGTGASSGTANASGVSAGIASAIGEASGSSLVSATSASSNTQSGTGSSSCTSIVTAIGLSTYSAFASSIGTSTAQAIGAGSGTVSAIGNATGTSSANGISDAGIISPATHNFKAINRKSIKKRSVTYPLLARDEIEVEDKVVKNAAEKITYQETLAQAISKSANGIVYKPSRITLPDISVNRSNKDPHDSAIEKSKATKQSELKKQESAPKEVAQVNDDEDIAILGMLIEWM